ncbi:MAG: type III polyketide synthase [Acidobacteriia bacterium]|nr:type III polyketide synthase [Terriglobia bacterium]
MAHPRILALGTANPPHRFTQEQIFRMAGYHSQRILEVFQNSDIDYRHLYVDPQHPRNDETPDELNARYLRGAMETGWRAIHRCLESAGMTPQDADLFLVCSCTGYVCPDVGTRLIGHLRFRPDIERGPLVGLGCAGAVPTLQRAWDYASARPGRKALLLTVEICSASYYLDNTLETVVGNAICADGAAAVLMSTDGALSGSFPEIVDFQSFVNPEYLDKVGFEQKEGKLRIILAAEIRDIAAPMLEKAATPLLARHGLRREDIRFWVAHPGGRKVVDNVQKHFGLTDEQMRFSKMVMRNYGNMSSATVLFVLDEVVRNGAPQPGDWGMMLALGPGMAAEAALLKW